MFKSMPNFVHLDLCFWPYALRSSSIYTNHQPQPLAEAKTWMMDATFRIANSPWIQLLILEVGTTKLWHFASCPANERKDNDELEVNHNRCTHCNVFHYIDLTFVYSFTKCSYRSWKPSTSCCHKQTRHWFRVCIVESHTGPVTGFHNPRMRFPLDPGSV